MCQRIEPIYFAFHATYLTQLSFEVWGKPLSVLSHHALLLNSVGRCEKQLATNRNGAVSNSAGFKHLLRLKSTNHVTDCVYRDLKSSNNVEVFVLKIII